MKTNKDFDLKDKAHYLPTFKRFPVCFVKGQGSYLWDVEGNKYLDLLAGIAVNCVGHSHPKMVKAIQEQAGQLIHISNFFTSDKQVLLSEKLKEISGMDRVFFSNSGAESVEGAVKIARKYAQSRGRGGVILSFDSCFHGRTLATIAMGKRKYQKGFDPIPCGFRKLPAKDMDMVQEYCDKSVAAIIIEPIQGEGGIHPAELEFMKELRLFCDRNDIVLIFDEIQCGIARTGRWFAKDHYDVAPDVMTLAKGLGGGVPIGAILSNEKVAEAIDYGDHGTTFGGNPLVCAASLKVLEIIEEEQLMENAQEMGAWLRQQIAALEEESIVEIRGMGLMIGVQFDFPTAPLMNKMFEKKIIVNATADNVLRLVPALNVGKQELEILMENLKASIAELKNELIYQKT
jgi:acetylornithine/N-succinyldiaminopimelate aminotransferase